MSLNEILLEKQAQSLRPEEVVCLLEDLGNTKDELSLCKHELEKLKVQVDFYKTQLFGSKSEKLGGANREEIVIPEQLLLGEGIEGERLPEVLKEQTIASHKRIVSNYKKDFPGTPADSGLRFDSNKAVVNEIKVPAKGIEGLREDEYEVISTNVYYRATKQVSYVVNKYIQDVVKIKASKEIVSTPLPKTIFPGGLLETSFIVGMLVDKAKYHLPLYRQNQMIADAHICLNRSTLVNAFIRAADLLEPLYKEIIRSIKESSILSMDEVPIEVGPSKGGGKKQSGLQKGYVWPIYGDKNEVAFIFKESRAAYHLDDILGVEDETEEKILLSDGYQAYQSYSKNVANLRQAYCWAHVRRKFIEALKYEQSASQGAVDLIAKLYGVEKIIREKRTLSSEQILKIRSEQSKPIVDEFFSYLDTKLAEGAFLPNNLFTNACQYAFKLKEGLMLYLSEPDLPIDNNHTERTIRPIVLGRKNWLFCWSEVGAKSLTIVQTLISSCVLQGISPSDYLNHIFSNIDTITNKNVRNYIPREWAKSEALTK